MTLLLDEAEAVTEGLAVELREQVPLDVADAVLVAVAVALIDGDTEGDAEADAEADAEGEGEGSPCSCRW